MLTLGNRNFREIIQESPTWPVALPDVVGTKTYIGNDFARVRGWSDIHGKLDQTNMVTPQFYLNTDGPVFAKDVIRLDTRMYWVNNWFRPWIGELVWGLYTQPGFGFQDTNDYNTDPDIGPFKQQTVDCGCNLRKLVGEPFWTRKGQYQEIEAVNYFSVPDRLDISYTETPHLCVKQTLASISQNEKVAYITHQKHADLVWPNLYIHRLIHHTGNLEKFPELPFETEYMGTPVTLFGFCFQASKVYGLFEDGWRVIEESIISGIGSAYFDRRVYVSKWLATPPPTIKGWTRGKDELFDWQTP